MVGLWERIFILWKWKTNQKKKPRGSQRKIRYLPGIYVHMQPLNVMIECNLGYIRLKMSLYLFIIFSLKASAIDPCQIQDAEPSFPTQLRQS